MLLTPCHGACRLVAFTEWPSGMQASLEASEGMKQYLSDLIAGRPRQEEAILQEQLGLLWGRITAGVLARIEGLRLEEAAIDLNLNLVRQRMTSKSIASARNWPRNIHCWDERES